MAAPPFSFPSRYRNAVQLARANLRCFGTTSMGRLFDTAAAITGFTRETTFEGQAAMWLERLARQSSTNDAYPFPISGGELDFRPLLDAMIRDVLRGRDRNEIARAFQRGIAKGVRDAVLTLRREKETDTIVLSGGVFQNELLLKDLKNMLESEGLAIWTNHAVPSNDGGISLGQAALAALASPDAREVLEETDLARLAQVTQQ